MTYGLLLRPEAESDVADAADWYDRQRPGLSLEFREALDKTFAAIADNPRSHPQVYRSLRRALVRRFPFGVFFVPRAESVLVVAILHTSRDPRLWRMRVRSRRV
jgi:plasmid stabilization system protein ParE